MATTSTFPVEVRVSYGRGEIPPRCRKPRRVMHETKATVEIPSLTESDFPVAFLIQGIEEKSEVRFYEGNLYAPHLNYARTKVPAEAGSDRFPSAQIVDLYEAEDDEHANAEAAEQFSRFVVLEGAVWVRTGEPRYVVMTFGLGCNHGGTSLGSAMHDNPNIRAENYHRADAYEEALAHAVQVATARGDDESIPHFAPSIEVLIPEAVTLTTFAPETSAQGDARWEYTRAVDALYNASTTDADDVAFAVLLEKRAELARIGGRAHLSEHRPFENR